MRSLPENIWNSPVIRKRLWQEAGFDCAHGISELQHYWIMAPEGDTKRGEVVLMNFKESPFHIPPHPMQQELARKVMSILQREFSHDGVWLVGWTHPPSSGEAIRSDGDTVWGRLVMIFLDEDADPQFTSESDHPFIAMITRGEHYYAEMGERGWMRWNEQYGKKAMKEDFGIKEDQTSKSALSALT